MNAAPRPAPGWQNTVNQRWPSNAATRLPRPREMAQKRPESRRGPVLPRILDSNRLGAIATAAHSSPFALLTEKKKASAGAPLAPGVMDSRLSIGTPPDAYYFPLPPPTEKINLQIIAMSKFSSLLAVCLLSAAAARADLVIVEKIDNSGRFSEMTLKMKGDKERIDTSTMSIITDLNTGDAITIMHSTKTFMKMPGATTKAFFEQMKSANPAASDIPPKLTATGRTEKINGYDTEEYLSDAKPDKKSYWIARDFPGYPAIHDDMLKLRKAGISALGKGFTQEPEDFPGMPIRKERETNGRKTTSTLISAKEEPVDDKEFEVPSDYKETAMPNLPGILTPKVK